METNTSTAGTIFNGENWIPYWAGIVSILECHQCGADADMAEVVDPVTATGPTYWPMCQECFQS